MASPVSITTLQPNAAVIAKFEQLLERAKRGEVQGFQAFLTITGSAYEFAGAGPIDFGRVLAAFEGWKHAQLIERKVVR